MQLQSRHSGNTGGTPEIYHTLIDWVGGAQAGETQIDAASGMCGVFGIGINGSVNDNKGSAVWAGLYSRIQQGIQSLLKFQKALRLIV